MARRGKLEAKKAFLDTLLETSGFPLVKGIVPLVTWEQIVEAGYGDGVMEVYRSLGGLKDEPIVELPEWDYELSHVGLELDEDLHFNRYRTITLRSSLYEKLPNFPLRNYRNYCLIYEKNCLKVGKTVRRWSNEKAKQHFGKPGKRAVLTAEGSPLWKLRAFQDFLKDITPLVFPTAAMVRVSIWDRLLTTGKLVYINDILETKDVMLGRSLIKYIGRKLNPDPIKAG